MIRKIQFHFRSSKDYPRHGTIYCVMRPNPYKKVWFSLGIIVAEKEWENYLSANYFYHSIMPSLGIHYYKFSNLMDKIYETVKASKTSDAKENVQKLMFALCTRNM